MKYKRLELYLGWKCNYKCIFCIERRFIDKYYDKIISEKEIFKKLIKYKKLGYNHITFLGGEPFIQSNFLFALKIAKRFGYTILVTTNGVLLPFKKASKLYLPYIDELIISIPIINKQQQKQINGVDNIIDFNQVFKNIYKYWRGRFLKINIVLNKYNYLFKRLLGILDFLEEYKDIISEISFTYPDIDYGYYSKEYCKDNLAIRYKYIKNEFLKLEEQYKGNILYKIIDIPFCFLPSKKFIKLTDDYSYDIRLKIKANDMLNRNGEIEIPRRRSHTLNCKGCKYINFCWGPSIDYIRIFGDKDIKKIL